MVIAFIILTIALIFIAASCDARMDIVTHFFERSIYRDKNPQWYNPNVSYTNKKDKNLWKANAPWWLRWLPLLDSYSDYWHLQKTIKIGCYFAAMVTNAYSPYPWLIFPIGGAVWILVFNFYYNKRLKNV